MKLGPLAAPAVRWLQQESLRGAMVHAALDGRWLDTAIAICLLNVQDGSEAAIVTPRSGLARFKMRSVGLKVTVGGFKCLHATGRDKAWGCIWVVDPEALAKPEQLPFDRVALAVTLDSHAIADDPFVQLAPLRAYGMGQRPLRHHWFARFLAEADVSTITGSSVTAHYPEQLRFALRSDDPNYRRAMLCEDHEPPVPTTEEEFDAFCSKRITIKSDKRASLTDRQRAASEGSLAAQRPMPFDRNFVQRWVGRVREEAYREGKRPWVLVLKSRRGGITTAEQARSYWVCVNRPGNDCVTLAHTMDATQRIFRMVKGFHENDPEALPEAGNSKRSLEFANGSNFFISTAGGKSAIRGDGVARVHWSEVAKSCEGPNQREKVDEIMGGAVGAVSHGEFTLESTPNGRESFHDEYQKAKRGDSSFLPVFIRWFDDPMNRLMPHEFNAEEVLAGLTAEETELVEKHALDASQIAFRRRFRKEYGRLAPQEMPENDVECFIASGQCWFNTDWMIAKTKEIGDDPGRTESMVAGAKLWEWEAPIDGHEYVIGVDSSEGREASDPAAIVVLDKRTGKNVCTMHGRMEPAIIAKQAVELSARYNRALLGVEREGIGNATIENIKHLGHGGSHLRGGRLYHWKKDTAGWSTNPQTRPVMLQDLADALHGDFLKTQCPELIDECSAFRLHRGKYQADDGAHDDLVMAYAIAWQMREIRTAVPDVLI